MKLHHLLLLLFVAGVFFGACARDEAAGEAHPDHALILGTWRGALETTEGRAWKDARIFDRKAVFTEETVTFLFNGKVQSESTYVLDPTKDPKWIDITSGTGSNPTGKAVYELDGDLLKICFAKSPDERPDSVESSPDSPNYYQIKFRREAP